MRVKIEVKLSRTEFVKMLAKFIEEELANHYLETDSPEPYRAMGDRLVDDALGHID